MPRGKKPTFDTVRKLGQKLPDVVDSPGALKVHGKLLAFIPTNRAAEPDSVAFRVDADDLAELLAAAPEIYYLPGHYVGYNAVLVRLARVNSDALRDLLGMAHKFVTGNASPPERKRRLK